MRPGECLLGVAAVAIAALNLFGMFPRQRWALLAATVPVTAAVVQWSIESPRWHLAPLYAASFAILVAGVFYKPDLSRPIILGALVSALAGMGLAWIFPVFEFPHPSGPYDIGIVSLHAVDPNRSENHTGGSGHREIMLHVWYPAAASTIPPAPYAPRDSSPFRLFAQLPLVKTHAHPDAPAATSGANWPVLLFSSSWHGDFYSNTAQVEELVSQGFVVAAIDHPYGSGMTRFPDGRAIPAEPMVFWDLASDEKLAASIVGNEREINVRAGDFSLALDFLTQVNSGRPQVPFSGRLDLTRIGAFGFSFGGAVAAEACRRDSRFKAGIDMGGSLFGEVATAGVRCPFLFMDDNTSVPLPQLPRNPIKRRYQGLVRRDQRIEELFLQRPDAFRIMLLNSEHLNFSDTPSYSRLRFVTGAGAIDPHRATQIINAYALAFFRAYLLGVPEPLLSGPSTAFPEVRFSRGPASPPRSARLRHMPV